MNLSSGPLRQRTKIGSIPNGISPLETTDGAVFETYLRDSDDGYEDIPTSNYDSLSDAGPDECDAAASDSELLSSVGVRKGNRLLAAGSSRTLQADLFTEQCTKAKG